MGARIPELSARIRRTTHIWRVQPPSVRCAQRVPEGVEARRPVRRIRDDGLDGGVALTPEPIL